MKLNNLTDFQVEKSEQFQSTKFDIKNVTTILKILRERIYTNPIRTMLQEIMTNARDANIEANNPHIPIRVNINEESCEICIEDDGIGISPKRMNEVYVNYGSSSKNESDVETGGFGFGAKSPFAYTDMYYIVTTTKDKDESHRRRVYVAYIDESQRGDLNLIEESVTTEKTGTTIKIPYKPSDLQTIVSHIREIALFWKVRPILDKEEICGFNRHHFKYITDTFMLKTSEISKNTTTVLVDEIPYELNIKRLISGYPALLDFLDSYDVPTEYMAKISTLLERHGISLFILFRNSDVDISPSREDLIYSEKTKRALISRLIEIVDHINKDIVVILANSKDYHTAIIKMSGFPKQLEKFTEKSKYQDIPIKYYVSQIKGMTRVKYYYIGNLDRLTYKIVDDKISLLHPTLYYIDDNLKRKSEIIKHIASRNINVISPASIMDSTGNSVPNIAYEAWYKENEVYFNAVGIKKLSEVKIEEIVKERKQRIVRLESITLNNHQNEDIDVNSDKYFYIEKKNFEYMIGEHVFANPDVDISSIVQFFLKRRPEIRKVWVVKHSLKNCIGDNWIKFSDIVEEELDKIVKAPQLSLFIQNRHIPHQIDYKFKCAMKICKDPHLNLIGNLATTINTKKINEVRVMLERFKRISDKPEAGKVLLFESDIINLSSLEIDYPLYNCLSYDCKSDAVVQYLDLVYDSKQKRKPTKYQLRRKRYGL